LHLLVVNFKLRVTLWYKTKSTSTSSKVGELAQRCKARLQISQYPYHDEFYKLLVSGSLDDGVSESTVN
jgi:hypothetical protein